MSVVLFLIILAALIFVHELGHFIVAKLSGIRVDEFAIGFPPRIFSLKRGETTYTLNLIPFGGFVKIFGENPDENSLEGPDRARSFIRKPRITQAVTLVAGIAFNIIFAWILIALALTSGLPAPRDYNGATPLQNPSVAIVEVIPNSPAFRAGFIPGDRILGASIKNDTLEENSAESIQKYITSHADEEITFSVLRKKEVISLSAKAGEGVVEGRKVIGFSLSDIGILKLPFFKALIEGAEITAKSTYLIGEGLIGFVGDAFLGKAELKQVTGPIGIVGLVGEASEYGLAYLLNFTAFISINLAVINLLPFPALDGGRLAVVGIEAVIRRPLNYKYVNAVNAVGFVLLILLMILVSYQDIVRLLSN